MRFISIKYVAEVEISLAFTFLRKILHLPIFGTTFLKFGNGFDKKRDMLVLNDFRKIHIVDKFVNMVHIL